MAGFDPDIFGGGSGGGGAAPGFDPDVFAAPAAPARTIEPAAPASQAPARSKFDLRGEGYDKAMNYDPRNAVGGTVRGSGSLGATLLRPFESAQENATRRASIDEGLTSLIGSDPNSTAYQTTKFLTEMAGTSGVGGLIAKGVALIPKAAAALPTLLPAIQSGGMSVNGAKGIYGAANRVAGGTVNGAATAGLVNPQDTDTGAMIGSVIPPAVQVAGKVGKVGGGALHAPPINPALAQTARESVEAGYVIPPNMVNPSLKNQVIESISGKQATQQLASTRNNAVTEKLTKEALGLPQDAMLSQSTLENLRKTAGKAYSEVSALSPQASADLEALKIARNESQAWFKAYNRSASPLDLAKAKQLRADAEALELTLEGHAKAANRPELIPALHDARKQIAKTYTVGRALNDASGTVDARVLGRMHEKGMPLSGGLEKAGKFASAFPSVSKSTQQVGSPAAHNLKAFGSALMGSGGYMTLGPLGAAAAAVPFVAPPIARSIMFSKPVQRSMVSPASQGRGLLAESIDEMLPLLYRSGSLLTSGR